MFISILIVCVFLGGIVGFLAGLLGIGGGLIIVPALVYIFPLVGINNEIIMPMALGTSLAAIVLTSSSAAFAHSKKNNIPWQLTKPLIFMVSFGALLGAFIAARLTTEILVSFFATVVILLALYMLFSISKTKAKKEENVVKQMPANYLLQLICFITGIIASLMGIAGGAILVPVLTYLGLPIRQSIGIATACGVMVALFGSAGYIITGVNSPLLPEWSLGYIYVPALVGLVISSTLLAPVGVKFASKLPVKTLKKGFAIFLILVALKMLLAG